MSALATAVRDAAPQARPIAGWMVLAIDGLRLALPQRDVRLIELLADLAPATAGDVHGSTSVAGGRTPGATDVHGSTSVAGGRTPGATDVHGSTSVAGGRTPGATDVHGSTSVAQAPSAEADGARRTPGARAIGWLSRKEGEPWPVYCLDGGLQLQHPVPPARRLCVFIEAHDAVTGIACDRVQLLATDAELTVEPVPGCMTGMPSPITGFARHQAGITVVVTATVLADYLAFLQEHGHGAHQ
jgi:hypothetical protein